MNDEEIIEEVVAAIRDGYRPERIIMFGSRNAQEALATASVLRSQMRTLLGLPRGT